jgi:ribose transport system substrate-binding protein
MKKIQIRFLLLLSFLLIFSWSENKALSKKYVFAWIPSPMDAKSLEICQKAIRAKIQEIKSKFHDEIEIINIKTDIQTAADQFVVMKETIRKKVDGIAISCMDPISLEKTINQAVDQQIPVMCWNSDSPLSKRFTYLGMDYIKEGRKCAEVLLWFMGGEGEVAVVAGMPGDKIIDNRIEGFKEYLRDFPDINIVETVYVQKNKEIAVQLIEETMMKNKNIKGWFFADPWPFYCKKGSMPTWESATNSMKITNVATGNLPINIELINQGYIKNYTTARLWNWGYYSIEVLYRHISEGKKYNSYYDPLEDESEYSCPACQSRAVEFW